MAEDEIDFTKLSIEERCAHKNFKARVSAYEELIKIFNNIDDDKSPDWLKYSSLVKHFPVDSHAAAQEKGLEATLIFIEKSSLAPRLVSETMSGVINKGLSSNRAHVKELSVSIIMMCVEIERYETVQDEIAKGLEAKNPKVVAACITVFTQVVREFGAKIFKVKGLCKKLITLLEDRDKTVRDETKKLVIEFWRWIGPAFKQELSSLKPILMTELDAEYSKVSGTKPQQTRYLRSQQEKKAKEESEEFCEVEQSESFEEAAQEIDPYELLQPEEILSKIPKDFYEKVEAKKWQERKEAVEAIESLTSKYPKLEPGDYADLVRALKRIIAKDSNVVVVGIGVKCITGLANGLKKKFSPFAPAIMSSLLEKFKEKKANVLIPLREAADAVYLCTSLEAIADDTVAALQNKNPSIKTEVSGFLGRAFSKTPNKVFTDKKFMKPFVTALLANLNEPDPGVRDAAVEALGVTYKAMGEKAITPFLADVEATKLAKIKDSAANAVIIAPKAEPKPKAKPKEAPPVKSTSAPIAKKGPVIKKANPGPTVKKVVKPKPVPDANSNFDNEGGFATPTLSEEVIPPVNPNTRVDLTTKLDDGLIEKLSDKNWKTREEALDKLSQVVCTYPKISPYLGDIVSAICLRLQDSNRTLASTAFVILQNLAGSLGPHCKQHLRAFLPNILSGLSENRANVRSNVIACLNAWLENTSLEEFFQGEMIAEALKLPSPLLRTELYTWLSSRLAGMKSSSKDDMASSLPMLFSSIEDRNVDVRKSASDCVLGFMFHFGYEKMSLLAGRLKPASKACVMAALDKARPLLPPKGPAGSGGKGKAGQAAGGSGKAGKAGGGGSGSTGKKASAMAKFSEDVNASKETMIQSPPEAVTPSSLYGSAETLVISPKYDSIEAESVNILNTTITLPMSRIVSNDWSIPREYQVDFEGIANKHTQFDESPMPPLVLLDTKSDFLNEPVALPKIQGILPPVASSFVSEVGIPTRAAQSIDMVIVQVAGPDIRQSMEALVQLETIIVDPAVSSIMYTRIDQLLICISMQMRKLHPTICSAEPQKLVEMEHLLRCIAQCLQSVYRQPELPRKVSMDALKDLIHMCLLILVEPTLVASKSAETILRYFNVLVVRFIERSDLNCSICACMRIMTDALNLPHFHRILDLTMKCQWKSLKQLILYVDEKIDYEFDIAGYLTEFHIFLKAHPFASWKHRDILPLKTMKTVVHNIVVKLGCQKVFEVLLEKDTLLESEAGVYIRKLIDREMSNPIANFTQP